MATKRASRTVALLVAASCGFAFGVVGTEATFGHLRSKEAEAPLLYSVEVRDDAGALLASPLLVGQPGKVVHLSLAQNGQFGVVGAAASPEEPATMEALPALQMSLDLSSESRGEAGVCVGYRLSIDDGAVHQGALHEGSIALAMGEPASVRLSEGGEQLYLRFTVARAGSKEFQTLLRKRRVRPLT